MPLVNGQDQHLFFVPESIRLMGNYTCPTGGAALSAAVSFGVYLFVKQIPEKEIRIKVYPADKATVFPTDTASKPQHHWMDFPLGMIAEMKKENPGKRGVEMVYFSDIPEFTDWRHAASFQMVTAYALKALFGLSYTTKELALLSQETTQNNGNLPFDFATLYTAAEAVSHHAMIVDCHRCEAAQQTVSLPAEEYLFVLVHSQTQPRDFKRVFRKRSEELSEVQSQINTFFDVPYLGMLTGEDHEWLDKLVEDDILKKRLRHIVNENTRVHMAADLLSQQKPEAFGKLLFDAHDSLAYDFEVSTREMDLLVQIASGLEGVAGAGLAGRNFEQTTLNLVKKEFLEGFSQKISAEYKQKTGMDATVFPLSLEGEMKTFHQEK
jgi:galactokinase